MARGKHGKSAQAKYDVWAEAELDKLRTELAERKAEIRELARENERVRMLDAQLRRTTEERDEATSPRVAELEGQVQELLADRDELSDYVDRVKRHWSKIAEAVVTLGATSVAEGFEQLLSITEYDGDTKAPGVALGVETRGKRLSPEAVYRIQRARGLRS